MKSLGNTPVTHFLLDDQNPRLPEHKQGATQTEILQYLHEHDVLDELIDSYIENGFFANEPLLVIAAEESARWIVVEGNRRTAALMCLLGTPVAQEAGLAVDIETRQIPSGRLDELRSIPVFQLQNRDEVSRYLGFRHISGLKTWGAEAKARYLWLQVERAARTGSASPFYDIGRQVGSNAAGVRTAYNAFNLLRGAERLGVDADIDYVKRERFGVWTRLLGTANVLEFMGLPRARAVAYEDVKRRAEYLEPEPTAKILADLKPPEGRTKAVLTDSRDVTNYSDVLGNKRAYAVLQEYGNLSLAVQVVEQGQLSTRLRNVIDTVEILTREVPRLDPPTDDDVARAKELVRLTRALAGAIEGSLPEVSAE